MEKYDSLELRYPKVLGKSVKKDRNVRWLVQHGFKGVKDDAGEINHYRYDIPGQFRGKMENIITIRSCNLPSRGWIAEVFNNMHALVVQEGNSICFSANHEPCSRFHQDVRECLLEINDGINELKKRIEKEFGPDIKFLKQS